MIQPQDIDEQPTRRVAGFALPWLASCTVHLTLLLLLAIVLPRTEGFSKIARETTGLSLEAQLISRSPLEREGFEDGSATVQLTSQRYFEDERPRSSAAARTVAATPGNATGGAQLLAMLNEKPALELGGLLPARGTALGTGGLEGGTPGSVGNLTTGGGGSNRLKGGYARTGVFGVVGEGHKFVYVFDRSGSMDGHGGLPLQAAKAELISSLRNLDQVHQFQIIFYNEKPRIFNPSGSPGRLVFATEHNKNLGRQFVLSITAEGATQHEEALASALRMAPDVVFFLTDADEPRMSPQQLARLRRLNQISTIHAIEFGYGPQSDTHNFLVRLAEENGGRHVYIDVGQLRRPQ